MVKVQWQVTVAVTQNYVQKSNKSRPKLGASGNTSVSPPGDHMLVPSQQKFTRYMLDKKKVNYRKKPNNNKSNKCQKNPVTIYTVP